MKKLLSTLLALSLALSLGACAVKVDPTGPDAPKPSQPETPELTFAVGTPLTHESTYTADDGTLLLHTNYELPQLELRTADGALYEPGAAATQSAAVAVRDAFNAEMERCYAAVLSNESELAQEARDHYGSDSMSFEYIYYEDELLGEVVYQTDGLISVLANAYAFYGGAHPNTSTLTWSFDLTTGEFLTLDALNAQSSTDSALGKTLVDTLASEIVNRIYEEGLDDYLYDDFYSYVYDLSSNAHFYFSGSGMTVNFDAYVLGPYASGPQTFEIPYSHFYNALDSHTQSLLNVPQDEIIIADYYTTKTLWSWFNMTPPPVDSSAELADEWLATGRFVESDGALYAACADRGSDITIDTESYLVAWNGDAGEIMQTITRREWNDETGDFVPVPGSETYYAYPFTTMNRHAVFSAFPCPY